MSHISMSKAYGYAWITLGLFVFSLVGHWLFGWFSFVDEQAQHGQSPEVTAYVVQMARDTFENWQSEFLQLLWQVGGLALFLFVGSPQSKEGSERLEAKIDMVLKAVSPRDAEQIIEKLDHRFARGKPDNLVE